MLWVQSLRRVVIVMGLLLFSRSWADVVRMSRSNAGLFPKTFLSLGLKVVDLLKLGFRVSGYLGPNVFP